MSWDWTEELPLVFTDCHISNLRIHRAPVHSKRTAKKEYVFNVRLAFSFDFIVVFFYSLGSFEAE